MRSDGSVTPAGSTTRRPPDRRAGLPVMPSDVSAWHRGSSRRIFRQTNPVTFDISWPMACGSQPRRGATMVPSGMRLGRRWPAAFGLVRARGSMSITPMCSMPWERTRIAWPAGHSCFACLFSDYQNACCCLRVSRVGLAPPGITRTFSHRKHKTPYRTAANSTTAHKRHSRTRWRPESRSANIVGVTRCSNLEQWTMPRGSLTLRSDRRIRMRLARSKAPSSGCPH